MSSSSRSGAIPRAARRHMSSMSRSAQIDRVPPQSNTTASILTGPSIVTPPRLGRPTVPFGGELPLPRPAKTWSGRLVAPGTEAWTRFPSRECPAVSGWRESDS